MSYVENQCIELRDRPENWSEKKAQLGLIEVAANSNFEPLGKRRRRNLEESQFSEETGGWRPPTRRSVEEDLGRNLSRGIADLRESVEPFMGGREFEDKLEVEDRALKELKKQMAGRSREAVKKFAVE